MTPNAPTRAGRERMPLQAQRKMASRLAAVAARERACSIRASRCRSVWAWSRRARASAVVWVRGLFSKRIVLVGCLAAMGRRRSSVAWTRAARAV